MYPLRFFVTIICIIVMSFQVLVCTAQNLIPNPAFEDTLACPTNVSNVSSVPPDQTTLAPPWRQTTLATADFFHQCNDSIVGVPQNTFAYQPAHSGNAYMGAWTEIGAYREYISAPLLSPLQAGVKYYGSVYVSLSAPGAPPAQLCDDFGMYFSVGFPDTTGLTILPYIPQIANPQGNTLWDTLNWMKISGSFVAAGGEDFITIGNFAPASFLNVAYYFIDDVCLSTDSLLCHLPVGIFEINQTMEINVFPNPFHSECYIQTELPGLIKFYLYDFISKKIYAESFVDFLSIDTENLSKGIYFYEVITESGLRTKGKIIKD